MALKREIKSNNKMDETNYKEQMLIWRKVKVTLWSDFRIEPLIEILLYGLLCGINPKRQISLDWFSWFPDGVSQSPIILL